jgi:hypothetical protein
MFSQRSTSRSRLIINIGISASLDIAGPFFGLIGLP